MKLFFLLVSTVIIAMSSIAQNVGIGTTNPLARLHVADSSVLFTGVFIQSSRFPPISGPGYRMMWFPSKAAFRVGYVGGPNWDRDSIGVYSFAAGYDTKAKGMHSFASGYLSKANVDYSTAMGSSIANGFSSMALGSSCTSNGEQSTAMGYFSQSNGNYSTAIGYINDAAGLASTAIGRSSSSIGDYSTTIGYSSQSLGYGSMALGYQDTARGQYAVALGYKNNAHGAYSMAMGIESNARSFYSTSMGLGTLAKASGSFVTGIYNDTSDAPILNFFGETDRIFQIGNGYYSSRSNAVTVLKNGNTGIGTVNPFTKLHVSAGSSGSTSSYYPFVVENSGNAYINLLSPNNNESGILFGKPFAPEHGGIIYDNDGNLDGFQFRTNGNNAKMVITATGEVGIATIAPTEKLHVMGNVKANAYLNNSDIRYKESIEPLQNSLEKLLQLQGVNYYFKKEFQYDGNDKKQVGFIAQEVEKIIPELIHTNNEGYKAIEYSKLTALLTEAIKEQQKQIEQLKLEVLELKKKGSR